MGNTDVYPASAQVPVRGGPAVAPYALDRLRHLARSIWASNIKLGLTIGVGALILRVAWVLSVTRHGWAINDALFYDIFATQLAKGHGYTLLNGAPSAAWPPAYPFVLSLAFRLFGTKAVVGELTNAFIGALTVPLLYLVGLRLFGRREAIFCAVALAVFPVQVFFTDVLVTETWIIFLIVLLLAMLTVLPSSRIAAIPVGLLVGVAALSHGEGILLIVIPMATWWGLFGMRERLIRVAILGAMVALVVAPWTIRNEQKLHARVLVSTNGGQTLYGGHNPLANGGATFPPAALTARFKAMPAPKGEVEQEKFLRHYAIQWAQNHPAKELLLIPERFIAWIGGDAGVFGNWINPQGSLKPTISPFASARWSLLANFSWYWLFGLFLFALATARRSLWKRPQNPRVAPVMRGVFAWFAVEAVVFCVLTFGGWRYHVALEPLMLLTVAPVVCALWARRREIEKAVAGPPLTPAIQGGNESC